MHGRSTCASCKRHCIPWSASSNCSVWSRLDRQADKDCPTFAQVGGITLGVVDSQKLCEALFDLYLGDVPVSKSAKQVAGESVSRMLTEPGHYKVGH